MRKRRGIFKVTGAVLVFLAWSVTTFLYDQRHQDSERLSRISTELANLHRYSAIRSDHQQLAKDLASLSAVAAALSAESSPLSDQLTKLALLQSLSAEGSGLMAIHYAASNLEELSAFLPLESTLRDSIRAHSDATTGMRRRYLLWVDSITTTLSSANPPAPGNLPARAVHRAAQDRLQSFQISQSELEDELLLLYSRAALEAEARARTTASWLTTFWLIATGLFMGGTVFLIRSDYMESRSGR